MRYEGGYMDTSIFNMKSSDDGGDSGGMDEETMPEEDWEAMGGDMEGDGKEQINSYLSDIPYPSTKEDMIEFAKSHGDGNSFLDKLDRIPEGMYESPEEVRSAINEFE